MFDLLARTRAALSIGVEHFSDPVLAHMKKLYNKDDIYWFFEEGTKYSYNYKNLMFIVAYPTETLEDFAQLKQGIIDISEITGKQVMTWDLNMCGTTIGSPIANLEGMHTGNNQVNWQYDKNPTLTSEEKARRIMELEDVMVSRKLSQPRHLAASLRIKSWLK